jgi:RNA polymerase sigma-70 factor (ECF subfamily)
MSDRPNTHAALEDAMRRAAQGDKAAYAWLLTNLTPVLRRIAQRRGIPPGDLDDVVQETLLTLHRCRATYDPARPFAPWLHALARHRIHDWQRRIRREQRRGQAVRSLTEAWSPALGTAPVAGALLLAEALAAQISALPPAQREAVEQLAIADRDLATASRATGRSPTALKVSLHRARQSIAAGLEEEARAAS